MKYLTWWWRTFVRNPLAGRCAWCDSELCKNDDRESVSDGRFKRSKRLFGIARWACSGCTEYPDG